MVFSFPLFCSQTICRKNMFRNHLYISAGEFFCLEKWNNTFLQLLILIPHLCCPPNFESICALASSLMSSYDRTLSFLLKGYSSLSLCKVSENHCTLPPKSNPSSGGKDELVLCLAVFLNIKRNLIGLHDEWGI